MATTKLETFRSTYRAYCFTCNKYVGKKKQTMEEAKADVDAHRSEPANRRHDTQVEMSQSFFLRS